MIGINIELVKLEKSVCNFVSNHKLFNDLKFIFDNSELVLFGGAIRDIYFNRKDNIKDLDIVVIGPYKEVNENIAQFETIIEKNFIEFYRNSFNGYKIKIPDCGYLDIWPIEITFAFRNKILPVSKTNLLDSVFLTADSIAFDLSANKLIVDSKFENFIKKKLIDLSRPLVHQLSGKSKIERYVINLNIVRALVFAEKYNGGLTSQFKNYICNWIKNDNIFFELYEAYEKHSRDSQRNRYEIKDLHELISKYVNL